MSREIEVVIEEMKNTVIDLAEALLESIRSFSELNSRGIDSDVNPEKDTIDNICLKFKSAVDVVMTNTLHLESLTNEMLHDHRHEAFQHQQEILPILDIVREFQPIQTELEEILDKMKAH